MKEQTFNQINDQVSSAYINGSEALPNVLIERTDKRITVGNLDRNTGDVLFTEDGQDKMHPNVSPELLTDAHQAELAERLAGKPLRGKLGSAALELTLAEPAQASDIAPGFIDRIPDHIAAQSNETVVAEVPVSPQEKESALSQEIDSLLAELSADDKDKLFRYSTYKSDKANAQHQGDGHASELAGQYMGQEYRGMSAGAQRIADQYHGLMQQLSWSRHQ
jgi:hypothetical protein